MTILRRDFDSYDAYVEAQGRKAQYKRDELMRGYERSFVSFAHVLRRAADRLNKGRPMLCLGARTGAESNAAIRVGFKGSVGVDLHPIGLHVQKADWHSMPQFADASFANVYTNSFDHCLYLDRAVGEIVRILTPDGRFYLQASDRGVKDEKRERSWLLEPKHNEALYWSDSDALRDAVLECGGLKVREQWREGIWGNYVFEKL